MLRRAAFLLPPLRRPLPPAALAPLAGAASRSLRSGPSGQRRRPPPLTPQLEAAAATTAEDQEEEEEEEEERQSAAAAAGVMKAAAEEAAAASRRARWEAVQRRAFERDGGEYEDLDEEEEEEEEEGEEEDWEVDLQLRRRRRVRNAPDALPQGQGDEGIGFALPSFSSFTPTDTAHSPTLQRAMRELLANPGAVHAEEERWRRRLGLGPTSRESVFEAMRRRLQAEERGASPSKRQLRLAAAVQGALSDCFYRDGLCPATKRGDGSPMVDITEVNMSADLRHAVVRWTPATAVDVDGRNGVVGTEAWAAAARLRRQLIRGLQAQLDKGTRRLRFECARRLKLKRVPALEFRPDEMVEAARAVDPLLGSLTLSPSSILEEEGEAEGKGEQRRGRDRR